MHETTASLKRVLSQQRSDIAAAHHAGADGFATCVALTAMMDDALKQAFTACANGENLAVLALGGYGRTELCPQSDVDVMVLADEGKGKQAAEETAKKFLHVLWDAGLSVGHSVRTVNEALAQHGKDIASWASMLESRFVCGDRVLADAFLDAMQRHVAQGADRWFIEGVFEEAWARHERFGNSVKLLEPNVKKSAGGLRDVHALLWLYRDNDPAYFFPLDTTLPAIRRFVTEMEHRGVLDEQERLLVERALQFLLRTRHEMHFRRGTATDGLEYSLQREIAESLGFGRRAELHSVEVFMREYYLHARTLHRLYRNLSHRFHDVIAPVRYASSRAEQLSETFLRHDGVLMIGPDVRRLSSAREVLVAFTLCAEYELELHAGLRRAIAASLDLFDDAARQSPELAVLFRRILHSRRVAATLHDMNELDVLGAYIPEWADLVAFFQHNLYHYFTADEHTIIALANAERLREHRGLLRDVFRTIRRKDVLYMALLLHDIAKPLGVADHEVTGVELARRVLERLGMPDAIPDVAFLIRHHLVMEQVAFRRNIHDPATIKEFAAKFERPDQLDSLYVLTYADLSAVNINVWTEWKASLLEELYRLTAEVLHRNLKGEQIEQFKQARHERAVETLLERLSATLDRREVEDHLARIESEAYVALFTEEEIAQHIHRSRTDEPVSTLFSHREGFTEMTVIADDAPFALSKFCAVLAANDANIFDANIFTRDDGVIIDRFRVSDATTKKELSEATCKKIARDLHEVIAGTLDIEHLFAAHRRKWKRRLKRPVNPNIRTDVQFEDHPRFTIVDVYAPDSLGFLYRVTETISKLGLDIYFAKIATRVDGIVDAFYVLDRNEKQITEPERRAEVRAAILQTIALASEQELASSQ
ncbi:MAG: [protein-PII] uridylyltransferase [Ignavibacteria bacterium]|mgnify:CR=1 FL=1